MSLCPALRDQEGASPWGSTRQNWRTERVLYGFQRVEEMPPKSFDAQEEHHKGIHDRVLRDQVFRESQLKIGWTEQKCTEIDKLAQQDHTYRLSEEEFKRYQGQWYLTLNESGKNAMMRLRPDFSSCSLHQKPSPSRIRRRCRTTHFSATTSEMALFLERFLVELGYVQKLVELMRGQVNSFFVAVGFVCSW